MKPAFTPVQMTRSAACHYLSVGETVFNTKYHPRLKWIKDGKSYLYLTSDIDALVETIHREAREEAAIKANPKLARSSAKRIRLHTCDHDDFNRAVAAL